MSSCSVALGKQSLRSIWVSQLNFGQQSKQQVEMSPDWIGLDLILNNDKKDKKDNKDNKDIKDNKDN